MRLKYYKYSLQKGVDKIKTKTAIALSISVLAVSGVGGLAITDLGAASAMPDNSDSSGPLVSYTGISFPSSTNSSSGLDNGWGTDRTFPSGGVTSTTSPNVLTMKVVGAEQSTAGHFYETEGIQHSLNGVDVVTARLYVSHDWLTKSVEAGIWGVGQDGSGNVTAYPILAFNSHNTGYNDPTSPDYIAGLTSYVGWSAYNDNSGGWVQLHNTPFNVDGWNTLSIAYNPTSTLFDLYINGEKVGSSYATGSANLSAVILDNFNFGGNDNYTVAWNNLRSGMYITATKADCMNGGWKQLATLGGSFTSQGQCVAYVNHHNGIGQDDVHAYDKKNDR